MQYGNLLLAMKEIISDSVSDKKKSVDDIVRIVESSVQDTTNHILRPFIR